MLRALADNASRRSRATLVLTTILFVVAVAVGGPVFGELATAGNPFTDPDSETEHVRERLERAAGEKAGVGLIALVEAEAPIESAAARERVEPVVRTLYLAKERGRDQCALYDEQVLAAQALAGKGLAAEPGIAEPPGRTPVHEEGPAARGEPHAV